MRRSTQGEQKGRIPENQAMFRSSLKTSNIGRAAGVCCLAVVCRVAGIGACEKEHPGRAKGTIKASGPSVTRHTTATQQTPAARPMFEVSSDDLNMA